MYSRAKTSEWQNCCSIGLQRSSVRSPIGQRPDNGNGHEEHDLSNNASLTPWGNARSSLDSRRRIYRPAQGQAGCCSDISGKVRSDETSRPTSRIRRAETAKGRAIDERASNGAGCGSATLGTQGTAQGVAPSDVTVAPTRVAPTRDDGAGGPEPVD